MTLLFKIAVFLFIVIFPFALLSRHYQNPYKLTFIFGKKGAGKSCLMVHEMVKFKKRGWTIYTDMADCRVPGVRIINFSHLEAMIPETHSAIFLDEAGLSMDNRHFKTFSDGLRDFFALQRKYKCRVFLNSQSYDVDLKVRSRVDDMILQTNICNCISISRPIRRSVTLTEPSAESESRIADRLSFAPIWKWRFYWMPRYFKYFESFNAPFRPPIPYLQIPVELRKTFKERAGAKIRALRRSDSEPEVNCDDFFEMDSSKD